MVLLFSCLFCSLLHCKLCSFLHISLQSIFWLSHTFSLSCHHKLWHYHYTQYWLCHCRTWTKWSPTPHLGVYGTQIHNFYSTVLTSFKVLLASGHKQNQVSSPEPAVSSALISFHCWSPYDFILPLYVPLFLDVLHCIQLYLTQIANNPVHVTGSSSRDYTACALAAFSCFFHWTVPRFPNFSRMVHSYVSQRWSWTTPGVHILVTRPIQAGWGLLVRLWVEAGKQNIHMCMLYSKIEKHWTRDYVHNPRSEIHLGPDKHELKAKLWFAKEYTILLTCSWCVYGYSFRLYFVQFPIVCSFNIWALVSYSATWVDEDAEWCCMESSCVTELDLILLLICT